MMAITLLKQSTLGTNYKLELQDAALSVVITDVTAAKKILLYRDITGLFTDAEKCHVVCKGDVVSFLHQPSVADYALFTAELVRRLKAVHGA